MNHVVTVFYDRALVKKALNRFFMKRLKITLFALPALLMLCGVFYFNSTWNNFDTVLATLLLVFLGIMIFIYILRLRMSYEFLSRVSDPSVEFTFTDEGVATKSELGSAELKWPAFNEILKFPDLWLLIYYQSAYLTLPTEAMSEECRAFIEMQIANLGGAKGKR